MGSSVWDNALTLLKLDKVNIDGVTYDSILSKMTVAHSDGDVLVLAVREILQICIRGCSAEAVDVRISVSCYIYFSHKFSFLRFYFYFSEFNIVNTKILPFFLAVKTYF